MPIRRPSSRWKYSHQKMPLNPARLMPWFTCRYSGVSRYFSNVCCHSASDIGGSVPTIGCHSTIDRPECVSRVTPPTTTIANTSAQHTNSHVATPRLASRRAVAVENDASADMASILPWRVRRRRSVRAALLCVLGRQVASQPIRRLATAQRGRGCVPRRRCPGSCAPARGCARRQVRRSPCRWRARARSCVPSRPCRPGCAARATRH